MTEAQGQPTPEAPTTQAETPQAEERTFTQADLKKIAANEKRDGKNAAINDLLQKTGAESIDAVLQAYTEYQAVQQANETAADKAEKAKAKAEAERDQYRDLHTNTLREFALRDALRDSGINSERLPLALKVADMASLEVKDGDVSGVEDVVEAIKEASPEWFGEARQRVNAPQTNGTGVSRPNGQSPEEMQAQWLSQFIGR